MNTISSVIKNRDNAKHNHSYKKNTIENYSSNNLNNYSNYSKKNNKESQKITKAQADEIIKQAVDLIDNPKFKPYFFKTLYLIGATDFYEAMDYARKSENPDCRPCIFVKRLKIYRDVAEKRSSAGLEVETNRAVDSAS